MTGNYQNFKTAMYVRALDIAPLKGDIAPFVERFNALNAHTHIDKMYLEVHRDLEIVDESTLVALKQFLNDQGIETSAGITVTIKESDNLRAFCYTNPDLRQMLVDIVTLSARLFDEVVFDDFYYTNCKCRSCVEAKGDRSWTEFRLQLMTDASKDIVLKTAREVNPNVTVVIKYPNWYEHFQGLGFNLKDQPPLYDGVYTGNETRDAMFSAQHLQPYESYSIFRYYENIKPGGNRGGWVDPYRSLTLDRYAEQLWLTLFAKSPEITLFAYHALEMPITESQRGSWQGTGTSLSYDAITAPLRNSDGSLGSGATMAAAAGHALRQIDPVIGALGNPVGVKSYKPYHSMGEDFLHNYLGMLGIPIELGPEFPADAQTILLTESAKHDADIANKIEKQLADGKTVVITSGLLSALQGKGLEAIVEMECTNRKMIGDRFVVGRRSATVHTSDKPILVPIIHYLTNDSWEQASMVTETSGTPILHSAEYMDSHLWVLTIPDDFNDLYHLPAAVLDRIREVVCQDQYVRLVGRSQVALFVYDNDTFIVESFLDEDTDIRLILDSRFDHVKDLLTEACYTVGEGVDVTIKAHSYRLFRTIKA